MYINRSYLGSSLKLQKIPNHVDEKTNAEFNGDSFLYLQNSYSF